MSTRAYWRMAWRDIRTQKGMTACPDGQSLMLVALHAYWARRYAAVAADARDMTGLYIWDMHEEVTRIASDAERKCRTEAYLARKARR